MVNLSPGLTATHILVDLADMKVTNNPSAVLSTNTLGAGVALTVFDPEARVGGIIHFMLPSSELNTEKALTNPYIFADTGIPLLFRRSYKLGALKQRLICHLAGGAQLVSGGFEIGQENVEAARDVLARNAFAARRELTGGVNSISIGLDLRDGRVRVIKSNGVEKEL